MNKNKLSSTADVNKGEPIFKMPNSKVEARWFTFENINGEN